MIIIDKRVFSRVKRINVHEACGFIGGKHHQYNFLYRAKNKSSNIKNKFKIGLWDKFKFITKLLRRGQDQAMAFHVHSANKNMSVDDVKHAKIGSLNMIIKNRKVYIYQVRKKIIKFPARVEYKVV